MRSASQAGIEGMNRAQDFEWPLRVGHRRVQQRRFVGSMLPLAVFRRRIPGRRHDNLIVLDLRVFDVNPVRQRAARRFGEAIALGFRRPTGRLPARCVRCRRVSRLQIRDQLVVLRHQPVHAQLRLKSASRRPSQRREQSCRRNLQRAQCLGDHIFIVCFAAGEADQHARQGPHLHRIALPAR